LIHGFCALAALFAAIKADRCLRDGNLRRLRIWNLAMSAVICIRRGTLQV